MMITDGQQYYIGHTIGYVTYYVKHSFYSSPPTPKKKQFSPPDGLETPGPRV